MCTGDDRKLHKSLGVRPTDMGMGIRKGKGRKRKEIISLFRSTAS
jgi:hypothetical protein